MRRTLFLVNVREGAGHKGTSHLGVSHFTLRPFPVHFSLAPLHPGRSLGLPRATKVVLARGGGGGGIVSLVPVGVLVVDTITGDRHAWCWRGLARHWSLWTPTPSVLSFPVPALRFSRTRWGGGGPVSSFFSGWRGLEPSPPGGSLRKADQHRCLVGSMGWWALAIDVVVVY